MSLRLVPKPDSRRLLEVATLEYHEQLLKDDEALSYLTKDRGISSEALESFRLGVVRDPLVGHETYRNRLTFPYLTPSGITTIRFRYLGAPGDHSKFLSFAGDEARIYNSGALMGAEEVYICEGETDTIAAWEAGLPAVGFPGAEIWSSRDKETGYIRGTIFSRVFQNRKVTVLADNDDQGAGKEFADDVFRYLGGCAIIMMDHGFDVSKYVQLNGPEALRKKVGV